MSKVKFILPKPDNSAVPILKGKITVVLLYCIVRLIFGYVALWD